MRHRRYAMLFVVVAMLAVMPPSDSEAGSKIEVIPLALIVSPYDTRGVTSPFWDDLGDHVLSYDEVYRNPNVIDHRTMVDCRTVRKVGVVVQASAPNPGQRSVSNRVALMFNWEHSALQLTGKRFKKAGRRTLANSDVRWSDIELRNHELADGILSVTVTHLGEPKYRAEFEFQDCDKLGEPIPPDWFDDDE